MPIRIISLLSVVAILMTCTLPMLAQETQTNIAPEGFERLFNGDNLSGWYAIKTFDPRKMTAIPEQERNAKIAEAKSKTDEHWRVENGEIVNDGTGPYLTTEREFRDFELLIDYKTVPKADSGIYLKATPQVQIWDTTKEGGKWGGDLKAELGSGGLWNNSIGRRGKDPIVNVDNPFGQWNRFRILQIGSRTSIWLNNKMVVDHAVMENYWDRNLPLVGKGPIQLQTHGGEIRWRNIFVREVDSQEANKILASHSNDGFEPIFNGSNFDGWAGPIGNYEVKDGAIRCKPHQGGTIYTDEDYSDFVVRLEFRLPPGGNNGLAIRYPGQGDTAYAGMCELQVLDSEHEKYGKLDARQYHGSAYGMQAAHRGYLRETGQWNFQEVTVNGSTIVVELNGTVILDCDLSKINEYMGNNPHPGKDRTSGHFGLAGHSDPVEFRNLSIKTLTK